MSVEHSALQAGEQHVVANWQVATVPDLENLLVTFSDIGKQAWVQGVGHYTLANSDPIIWEHSSPVPSSASFDLATGVITLVNSDSSTVEVTLVENLLSAAQVAELTAADVEATAADRVQTGLDRAQTSADRIQTGNDAATALAALVAVGAGANLSVTAEPLYVNGNQVMYALVDSAGRALTYIGLDGTVYGKLPVAASSGVALTRLADGSYTMKLDASVIDPTYGASDLLAAICDSAGRVLASVDLDGKLLAKLGITAGNGLLMTNPSLGTYAIGLDTSIIDLSYGGTDYLAGIVDSSGRLLLSIGFDGTVTGKINVTELVNARGSRLDLDTRLTQSLTTYGLPKTHTWGEWFLRETRMRLRKRALAETVQLTVAMIGDSWTHNSSRYSGIISSALKTAFGDAGAGWTGFGWGFGGASDAWSGGNGSASSDMAVSLTTGWTTHYNSSVSPDLADIYTATAAAKVTIAFTGTGDVAVARLFYIAGGSGILRYRWNAGTWTTLDISAGTGLLNALLTSIPTGTWTLELENVAGTTTVCGLDIQKTSSGVRLHKLGGTGSSSNSWAAVDATNWQAGLAALAPNLVTVLLGTNDQGASMTAATYRTNLQTMITRIRAALPVADIAIIMPCENQRVANTYAMSVYAKEAYELAATNNCAWLDLQYVFGDTAAQYAFGSARPWFASDLIHPDPTTGGRAITDAVYRLLTTQ